MPPEEIEKRAFYFRKSLSLRAFPRNYDDVPVFFEFLLVQPVGFPHQPREAVAHDGIADLFAAYDSEFSRPRGLNRDL